MRAMPPLLGLPPKGAEDDRLFVTALARGLELLRAFDAASPELGNAELAKRTGLPKPTVSRLAYTLSRLGYLEYLPQRERYRLGAGVLALGYPYVVSNELRRIARPYLQDLAEFASASVAICVRDRLSMVYREARHSAKLLGVRLDVGAQIPIAGSAAGMAALYAMSPSERASVLDALREQQGPGWAVVEARIRETHEQVASRGFCVVRGGVFADSIGVAAPLPTRGEGTPIVINCAAPEYLMSADLAFGQIGPRLADIAQTISG